MTISLEKTSTPCVTRYDLAIDGRAAYYGVGRMRTFHSGFAAVAVQLFVNSYVAAPVALRAVHCVGWLQSPARRRLAWTGSLREPRSQWYLRVGRAFVGGDTPAVLQRWLLAREMRRDEIEMAAYDAAHPADPEEMAHYAQLEKDGRE